MLGARESEVQYILSKLLWCCAFSVGVLAILEKDDFTRDTSISSDTKLHV